MVDSTEGEFPLFGDGFNEGVVRGLQRIHGDFQRIQSDYQGIHSDFQRIHHDFKRIECGFQSIYRDLCGVNLNFIRELWGLFLFVLWEQVEVLLESGAGHFEVVGAVVEVGEDDGVVAFELVVIDAVEDDAAVFLHFQFVAEPVGLGAVTLVFGGVEEIDPDVVVVGFAVSVDAGGVVGVVFEGEVESLIHLSSEVEVEVLFFVAGGHHVARFGVGQEGEVGFEVVFGF